MDRLFGTLADHTRRDLVRRAITADASLDADHDARAAAHEEVAHAQRLEAGKAAIKELAIVDATLSTDHHAELKRVAHDGERSAPSLDRVQPAPGGVGGTPPCRP